MAQPSLSFPVVRGPGGRARIAALALGPAFAVAAVALAGGAQPAATLAAAAITAVVGAALAARMGAPAADSHAGRAEALAAEAAALRPMHDALEALPDPVALVEAGDRDDYAARRLVFANAAARELLRVPREGGLLLTAVRRPEVLEALDQSLFDGLDAATAFEGGGAQARFWRVWTRPLPPREGSAPRAAMLLMRDETDARRNERMRADFLANASHELRTPLASLSGFVETLRGHAKEDPAARERFLGIMAGQAERMRRLIDDLLSLSRIELNEHIPPSGSCDLSLAVADVADALALLVRERGVSLEVSTLPKGRASVVGDRDQILQVIQNLIDNAAKYAGSGGTVRVSVEAGLGLAQAQGAGASPPGWTRLPLLTPDRTDGELFARVRVADTGPGIAREHLPRLAERFYRVEGQKSGERSGTGLGLAIVKHIANRHRGGVTVESAPGEGAAFSAYFPMAPTAPAAAEPEPATTAVTKLS